MAVLHNENGLSGSASKDIQVIPGLSLSQNTICPNRDFLWSSSAPQLCYEDSSHIFPSSSFILPFNIELQTESLNKP
jgi:hypothetical protein